MWSVQTITEDHETNQEQHKIFSWDINHVTVELNVNHIDRESLFIKKKPVHSNDLTNRIQSIHQPNNN